MSVYNDERYVRESIDGILRQTFADLEFIIIDDGSTDGTSEVISGYDDPRITILENDQNIGLTRSLNRGLNEARGEFIARQDADDVSEPERLEKQLAFMEDHPDVGILGTYCHLIDDRGGVLRTAKVPLEDLNIRWQCLIGNPFFHPAIMLRRGILRENSLTYDESFRTAQDYDFFSRVLMHANGANLASPLVRRRIHGATISRVQGALQSSDHTRIALRRIVGIWPDHPLTEQGFSELRGLLESSVSLKEDGELRRIGHLEFYRELLKKFAERQDGRAGLAELVRKETAVMALLAFRPPWRAGAVGFFIDSAKSIPGFAGYFAFWAFMGVMKKIFRVSG